MPQNHVQISHKKINNKFNNDATSLLTLQHHPELLLVLSVLYTSVHIHNDLISSKSLKWPNKAAYNFTLNNGAGPNLKLTNNNRQLSRTRLSRDTWTSSEVEFYPKPLIG